MTAVVILIMLTGVSVLHYDSKIITQCVRCVIRHTVHVYWVCTLLYLLTGCRWWLGWLDTWTS